MVPWERVHRGVMAIVDGVAETYSRCSVVVVVVVERREEFRTKGSRDESPCLGCNSNKQKVPPTTTTSR